MCPLQRPRPSPPADAGIRLLCPVPVTSGRTGAAGGGKFKNLKKCLFFLHCCFNPFHIHIVPSALSCALPAFCLFFLPGN
ncbi:unnamed protein product [Staurois parvus]|uniref:Uncharacterized protein n=1 Tax=Staurois parvus TaxID=386267 RepID=A0ABN9HDX0_9NEOB|nr:unnamed protein product [Staurois parvus]